MSNPNDSQYEPGRSDVDSDIDLDLDDIDQPRPTYRSKNFRKTPKTHPFWKFVKKKYSWYCVQVFIIPLCMSSILFSCNMVKIEVFLEV